MTMRHVRQGEDNVTRQRDGIAWRRANGLDATFSEELLGTFEMSLRLHRAHLERLLSQ